VATGNVIRVEVLAVFGHCRTAMGKPHKAEEVIAKLRQVNW
jgi:hypothetical protein